MLDAYGIPQTPPDFYPIVYTPRTLLGISSGIKIIAAKTDGNGRELVLREAVKKFVDRWRELIGADTSALSLVRAEPSSDGERLTYRQANYAFPIAGSFGEIVVGLSPDGRLTQLDDRLIPLVELPSRPKLERDEINKRIAARTFPASEAGGAPISGATDAKVKQLVVLPLEKGDIIEVRLAWEIIVGKSFTLYLDAMTGEDLKKVQNAQA